jgi:integrase
MAWRDGRMHGGKAYRLLRAMMRTAVADEVIVRKPCVVERGGVEHSPERPVLTVAQVGALADAIAPRFRALVTVSAWCGLRRGECLALRRSDFDPLHKTLRVERSMNQLIDETLVVGPPKTEAGLRSVAIPPHIIPDLMDHLDRFVDGEPGSLFFTGEKGGPVRPHVLQKAWTKARSSVAIEAHLHDLRHAGNTWAAATGASTKELMVCMSHANAAAALRYQHATADRDQAIARALPELATAAEGVPLARKARPSAR